MNINHSRGSNAQGQMQNAQSRRHRSGPQMRWAFLHSALCILHLLVIAPSTLLAQGLFIVTGQSRPGSGLLELVDGTQRELPVGRAVTPGLIQVPDQAQLMLLEESGVVAILVGPASMFVLYDELQDEIRAELRLGKVLLLSAAPAGGPRGIVLTVPAVGARPAVGLRIGPGRTYVELDGERVAIAYVAEPAPPSLSVTVDEALKTLPSGHLLLAEGPLEPSIVPIGNWPEERGFALAWGRNLGVESAREARKIVEQNLFYNIIAWDRYAAATYVAARLREWRFNPELRQTVQSVSGPTRATGRGAAPRTQPFPGANEVPIVSPAAASVQNLRQVGQAVTAAGLNAQAADFLQRTGSRGLGFRGLQQLAMPAQSETGTRTAGPAGLGAP